MQVFRSVSCPYCKVEQEHEYTGVVIDMAICTTEEGGCDGWFIIDWEYSAEATARKIEGEPQEAQ